VRVYADAISHAPAAPPPVPRGQRQNTYRKVPHSADLQTSRETCDGRRDSRNIPRIEIARGRGLRCGLPVSSWHFPSTKLCNRHATPTPNGVLNTQRLRIARTCLRVFAQLPAQSRRTTLFRLGVTRRNHLTPNGVWDKGEACGILNWLLWGIGPEGARKHQNQVVWGKE
jgi:hypothetical protein